MNHVFKPEPQPQPQPFLLECQFYPKEIKSSEQTILYTLWRAGELPYHDLLLTTDLDTESLNKELDRLIEIGTVKRTMLSEDADIFKNKYITCSFKINRTLFDQ